MCGDGGSKSDLKQSDVACDVTLRNLIPSHSRKLKLGKSSPYIATSYAVEDKNNKENLFMKVNNNSNGIGFVGALTIAFVVLKLMKIIDWSWWWVLSPLWISTLVVIVVIAVVFLVIWLKEAKRG